VANFDMFHDRSPNGEAIMNTGAAIPKKRMEDFITLAKEHPQLEFNLYAMGYDVGQLRTVNRRPGDRLGSSLRSSRIRCRPNTRSISGWSTRRPSR
jgi:hypothetical protein